ncbi:MAG: M16 family metallopeptidase [Paracoccaceae bacterium]
MIRALLAALALTLAAPAARAEIDIQQITSPGGIDAWLAEAREIPFVAVEIIFEGGAATDPEGARGAANLMTGLIEEGAGDLDAQAFQAAREGLAASFGFDVGQDLTTVSARFLTQTRDEAVALLASALTEPRFDADAIERVRAQVLAGLRAAAQDPDDIASNALNAQAFPGDPYATAMEGTADSVAALTRQDLLDAHARLLVRDRAIVAVVGDIDAAGAGAVIDALLGDLPTSDAPPLPPAQVALTPGVTVIDFPSPQSTVLFAHEGIARDDPDFIAATILNHIVGGRGQESRLMAEVRGARGLTYGVYSFLVPRQRAALYMGSVRSSNETVAEAIEVVRDEWRRASEGVTAEELAAAKRYLTGAYPLRFDGNAAIADIAVGMQLIGLPASYVVERNDLVEAVTLEEINALAAELFDPDALRFVVVGQPQGLAG